MNNPLTIVVFGATGDLAHRKLFPALFQLFKTDCLPQDTSLIAIGRSDLATESFIETIAPPAIQGKAEEEHWKKFQNLIRYQRMDLNNGSDYAQLVSVIESIRKPDQIEVFYFSVAPSLYGVITENLNQANGIHAGSRVVIEKPLGHDQPSAQAIDNQLTSALCEDQIYRIDHYLGKETVQNLMALRFGNSILEPLWCAERIESIQITVAEEIGVDGRGAYYDNSGALRDMVQNHLLQLLCIVAMEPPAQLTPYAVRDEKLKVLHSLRAIRGQDVQTKTIRGQYRDVEGKSYINEPGVSEHSATETYVALKVEVDNWRWAGVPIYLRTGKKLKTRRSDITIQFKQVPHQLFQRTSMPLSANRLVIRLQPEEDIRLFLNAKTPGKGMSLEPVVLNMDLAAGSQKRRWDAYERLILDVIQGDLTLFMRGKDIETAWGWIDPIIAGWQEFSMKPAFYDPDSWGPVEADQFLARDGFIWHNQ